MATFEQYRADYKRLWDTMEIRPERISTVTNIARRLLVNKDHYVEAQKATGVPWFVIAAWHERESGANFNTQLAQGDPLNRVSTHVPAGRGPFSSWVDSAVDALVTLKHLDQIKDWTPERACYETERYNGFGYRSKGIPSPYLWSFSNHYSRGKYVADHEYDSNVVDKQCGALPIVKRIMELDSSARFKAGTSVTIPAVIVGTGGGIATVAYQIGVDPQIIMGIIVFAAVAAVAYFFIQRFKRR